MRCRLPHAVTFRDPLDSASSLSHQARRVCVYNHSMLLCPILKFCLLLRSQ